MAAFRVMRGTSFILALVAGIMAIDDVGSSADPKVQVIRVGEVASGFSKVQGYLIPAGYDAVTGMPNYEFRSTINGVPVQDKEFINCHCEILYRYPEPSRAGKSKPVLLCKGSNQKKGSQMPEKLAFLFAAESLNLGSEVKGINLMLGKNTWKNLIATHASAATAAPDRSHQRELTC